MHWAERKIRPHFDRWDIVTVGERPPFL